MTIRIAALSIVAVIALPASPFLRAQTSPAAHYERVYTLKPREGVFAYARISPDGKRLAYASQVLPRPAAQRGWAVNVVELTTQKILFSEQGIDAYWSNDGTRLIYSGSQGVTIWNVASGEGSYTPEASPLGDYYSWAVRDGKDLVLTIQGNYYFLNGNKPILPHSKVPSCDRIGTGERPLI